MTLPPIIIEMAIIFLTLRYWNQGSVRDTHITRTAEARHHSQYLFIRGKNDLDLILLAMVETILKVARCHDKEDVIHFDEDPSLIHQDQSYREKIGARQRPRQ